MARIIRLGNHVWVAGLRWRSYVNKPTVQAVKDDALDLDADWVATRITNDVIQVGYCEAIDGYKKPPKKAASLAAKVAGSRRQPWLGIYQLEENLWWYIAVRDGLAVLPDGDVIGTYDDVTLARERHQGYGDWNYVEGGLAELEEVLAESDSPPVRMNSLYGPPVAKIALAAGVGLVALVGLAGWWFHIQAVEKEQQMAMEAMRAKLSQLAGKKPAAPVIPPYQNKPLAVDWIEACAIGIKDIPLGISGWSLDSIACADNGGTAIWKRNGATVWQRPDGLVSDDGETVTQTLSWTVRMGSAEEEGKVASLQDGKQRLQGIFQSLGVQFAFDGSAAAPATLPGSAPVDGPSFPQVHVKFTTTFPPFVLADALSTLPGLRMESLKLTGMSGDGMGRWDVSATLYGK